MKTILSILFLVFILTFGCGRKEGINYLASGLNEARIYVVNAQTTAPTTYTVTVYDEKGNLLGTLADYTRIGAPIRGIEILDPTHFLISLENIDRIDKVSIWGETSIFAADSQFNGTIFDLAKSQNNDIYVIEGNTIEKFDSNGVRYGITATPYINTTVGTCVLNIPRKTIFNSRGHLVVTNTGNDRINIYNVSNSSTPACVSFNSAGGAVDPISIIEHSDGNYYVGNNLLANSQIVKYNSTLTGAPSIVFNTNAAIISTPAGLAEMPDGSLLVASDGTDSIVRIATDGSVLDNPFIKNTHTGSIVDILVVPGQ